MTVADSDGLSQQAIRALEELKALIRSHYPNAQFEVERGIDDPEAIHLITTVNIEETEDVIDLVIDRLLDLQEEEQLPIHVIPVQPLARVLAAKWPSAPSSGAVLGNASPQ